MGRSLDLTLQCGWITEILSLNFCRSNLKGFRLNHFQRNLVLQDPSVSCDEKEAGATGRDRNRKPPQVCEQWCPQRGGCNSGSFSTLTSFSKSLIVSVFIYFVLLYILNYFTTSNKKTHILKFIYFHFFYLFHCKFKKFS